MKTTPNLNRREFARGLTLAAAAVALPASAFSTEGSANGGQSILLNDKWRFYAGDPPDAVGLDYDIRPKVEKSADGKAADARPEAADGQPATSVAVLKPWILPTANPFIRDPARHHVRPAGDPGSDVSFVKAGFDDSHWRQVQLPHDWAIEGPFLTQGPYGGMGRLKSWGAVWYRRALDIRKTDAGKSIFLDVEGAMSYASVWLNGQLVGGWPYGYASWRLDLTPYIALGGPNQLVIRLDNPPESARWYPGAGLYRNIWLTRTNAVHVGQWGTFVRTPEVSAATARIEMDVVVDNDGPAERSVEVETHFYATDAKGQAVGKVVAATPRTKAVIAAKSSVTLKTGASVNAPQLWGPPPAQMPNRYCAVTKIYAGGRLTDSYETVFGIRSVQFDPDAGVRINGQLTPLYGTNNHHDLGALGAAFSVRAAERQLEILRDMGCNALRMCHNPPAPELLDLADRMGFLVIDEVFDSWYQKKTPLDFHLIFPDWHEADLRAMIRRDRNHPSVILWSVGNEVGEQYTGADGAKVGQELTAIAHEEDATRPTMTAMNYAKADMALPGAVDVISLNYQGAGVRALPSQFPAFRAKFPKKVILSSESAAALSSRGEYQFPVPGGNSAPARPGVGQDDKTQQVSAYELFAADFGTSADRSWAAQDQNPFVAGEFVWSGFDYLGEPTPYYSARSSYYGIIDLAGFKKDRFYLYQSRWRPDLAMAHILPHWTWPGREGALTPVHVFTSGDEAELFVNGQSMGRKKKGLYEYRLRWDYVTYAPGEVSVVAYKNGKEWARQSLKTAGAAASLESVADRIMIAADGYDLSYVAVRLLDKDGNPAPQANNRVTFHIEGPGDIIATDNGDPTSFESFQSPSRKAFNGQCLAIIRSQKGRAGAVSVSASADGLAPAMVKLRTT